VFKFLRDLRARWIIYRTRRILEKRLDAHEVKFVVNEQLTLTAYDIERKSGSMSWQGKAFVPFWGKKLSITVRTNGADPSPEQVRLLKAVMLPQNSLRDDVLARFVRFYNRHVYPDPESHRIAERYDTKLPPVASNEEMCRVIGDPHIQFSEYCPSDFVLTFRTMWRDTNLDMQITNFQVDDDVFP
jgi:hypothetical protein